MHTLSIYYLCSSFTQYIELSEMLYVRCSLFIWSKFWKQNKTTKMIFTYGDSGITKYCASIFFSFVFNWIICWQFSLNLLCFTFLHFTVSDILKAQISFTKSESSLTFTPPTGDFNISLLKQLLHSAGLLHSFPAYSQGSTRRHFFLPRFEEHAWTLTCLFGKEREQRRQKEPRCGYLLSKHLLHSHHQTLPPVYRTFRTITFVNRLSSFPCVLYNHVHQWTKNTLETTAEHATQKLNAVK